MERQDGVSGPSSRVATTEAQSDVAVDMVNPRLARFGNAGHRLALIIIFIMMFLTGVCATLFRVTSASMESVLMDRNQAEEIGVAKPDSEGLCQTLTSLDVALEQLIKLPRPLVIGYVENGYCVSKDDVGAHALSQEIDLTESATLAAAVMSVWSPVMVRHSQFQQDTGYGCAEAWQAADHCHLMTYGCAEAWQRPSDHMFNKSFMTFGDCRDLCIKQNCSFFQMYSTPEKVTCAVINATSQDKCKEKRLPGGDMSLYFRLGCDPQQASCEDKPQQLCMSSVPEYQRLYENLVKYVNKIDGAPHFGQGKILNESGLLNCPSKCLPGGHSSDNGPHICTGCVSKFGWCGAGKEWCSGEGSTVCSSCTIRVLEFTDEFADFMSKLNDYARHHGRSWPCSFRGRTCSDYTCFGSARQICDETVECTLIGRSTVSVGIARRMPWVSALIEALTLLSYFEMAGTAAVVGIYIFMCRKSESFTAYTKILTEGATASEIQQLHRGE